MVGFKLEFLKISSQHLPEKPNSDFWSVLHFLDVCSEECTSSAVLSIILEASVRPCSVSVKIGRPLCQTLLQHALCNILLHLDYLLEATSISEAHSGQSGI